MEAGEVERCSPVTCGALIGFPVICWGLFRFRQICEGTAVEKQSPCVYVAFLTVTLLLIAGPKNRSTSKQTVSIKALTLGVVYQSEPQPVAEHFRPLVEYTARKLAPTGEIKSSVIVANGVSQLIELVERAQVDFYLESPFPTYLINRTGTGRLLLRRWKGGMSEYRGGHLHEQGKSHHSSRRSTRQDDRFRRSWIDIRLFFAQALAIGEAIPGGGKTGSLGQGLGGRNRLYFCEFGKKCR